MFETIGGRASAPISPSLLLADARVDAAHHGPTLAAYEALIAADPESPRRRADRRWLLEWRAEHAPEGERATRLLEWARAEGVMFFHASL